MRCLIFCSLFLVAIFPDSAFAEDYYWIQSHNKQRYTSFSQACADFDAFIKPINPNTTASILLLAQPLFLVVTGILRALLFMKPLLIGMVMDVRRQKSIARPLVSAISRLIRQKIVVIKPESPLPGVFCVMIRFRGWALLNICALKVVVLHLLVALLVVRLLTVLRLVCAGGLVRLQVLSAIRVTALTVPLRPSLLTRQTQLNRLFAPRGGRQLAPMEWDHACLIQTLMTLIRIILIPTIQTRTTLIQIIRIPVVVITVVAITAVITAGAMVVMTVVVLAVMMERAVIPVVIMATMTTAPKPALPVRVVTRY